MIDWLLHRLLDDRAREAVIGDLHEGHAAVRRERGAAAAHWWYLTQAARSIVTCRVTGHRSIAAQRLDDDCGARPTVRDLLRPALRQFRDHPLYASATAGTLALAIGAACASLAVAKQALLDPLPYRDGDALVSLLTATDLMNGPVSAHVLRDLRASNPPLVEFAPIAPVGAAYSTADSTETIRVSFVTAEYFTMLGTLPARGRVWTAQEPGAVVISAEFWRDRLAAAPEVIGRSIVVNGQARPILGVMPEGFVPPYFVGTDAWAPLDMTPMLADVRGRRQLTILARRAPGVTGAELEAYMSLFSRQLQERFPEAHAGQRWVALPLRDELVGSARSALLGTAGAAALLLLIVAANIAGLATAHTVAVRHQLAVRAALGASQARLFADQLVNSTLLALMGSIAGLGLGWVLTQLAGRYQESFLGRLAPVRLDAATVTFGLLAGIVVGVGAALVPRGLVSLRPDDALRNARGSSADVRVTARRAALVVAQVAIALVLIVGAGLLVRTVQHLSSRELGFDPHGLAWVQVTLPGQKYNAPEAHLQFEDAVLDRVRHVAGVTTATASVGFPLWGGMMAGMALKADIPGTPRRDVAYLSVSPNFTRDVGARIVAGRDLLPSDHMNAPRVVIINETMARMFWPNGDAIGSQVQIGAGSPDDRWITVVGVMADMRGHGLTSAIRPTAFGSTRQYSWPRRHIGVRVAGALPPALATDLRRAIHAVDPTVAIGAMTRAEQNLTDAMARHRLVLLALGIFGGIALVLCLCGLYAVVVLNAQQRRREYAIRFALGARSGSVRWMVVRQALLLGGAGTLAGLGAAALGTRALQGMLHGVQPLDTPTFAVCAAALLALATVAAWWPARSAARVNPVEALRIE